MTTTESIAAAINLIDEKKQNLKKAFDHLQAHRSLLSPSFSLSWSEIDAHFSSLQSSLTDRFRLLQSEAPVPNDAGTSSEEEAPVVSPELRSLCEKMDKNGLIKYLIDRWDDQAPPNMELAAAIPYSPDPALMVLDAIKSSNYAIESSNYSPSSKGKSFDVRRVFVLLMEALIEINVTISVDIRDRAKELASDWKNKIRVKPFEALLFLHLVAAFKLGSEFSSEEVSDYIFMIAKYKQAASVCNKIGLDRGRVGELIKRLLDSGKPVLSVRFMYECGMSDEFEPVAILKGYVKESREAAHRVCVENNYSLQSQNQATDKEVSVLKSVIKIIKDHNLESEFTQEKLEERVEELEKQKAQRKKNSVNQQEAQKKGRKRTRDGNGTQVPAQILQQPFSRPEAVLMHDPNHQGLLLNSFHLLNSGLGGGVAPYVNPLPGLYGSATTPQPVYYGQQPGFVLPNQYRPPYYSQ